MALKNQSVVDKWNTLVLNGAGRATHVLQTIDKKIQEANIPGIRKSMQEVSQGGLFAAKRPFLICANNTLPDFYLYIGYNPTKVQNRQ
jgi:hypothetical protein